MGKPSARRESTYARVLLVILTSDRAALCHPIHPVRHVSRLIQTLLRTIDPNLLVTQAAIIVHLLSYHRRALTAIPG